MNRKQRRAALKHGRPASSIGPDTTGDQSNKLLAEALEHERHRRFDEAARAYKRALQLNPEHAEACNNLGRLLLTQGKQRDASIYFARSLALMPQLLKQYAGVRATLVALLPTLADAIQKQTTDWPRQLNEDELFGETGLAAIGDNALLLHVLQSIPVQDIAFERLLTALRRSLLTDALAGNKFPDVVRGFACALARQCFINEYVFATSKDEDAEVARLNRAVHDALVSDAAFDPAQLAVLAMYEPLHVLAFAPILLDRTWMPAVDDLLTQQLREPMREIELRDSIPCLTAVEDDVSLRVQQQYEESPYPRWIHAAGQVTPLPIDQYLRDQFPGHPFVPLGKTDAVDILIAGCGTGEIAIASVQKYLGARALAIDLSLSSLSFAKRSTPAALTSRIEYAQADILKLATIERSFDVIDCSGVLHHMADPHEGWRTLLTVLRPGGFMHLGFYSEAGRRDVVAARSFIAERGYRPTPDDIRRCRQQLLETPLSGVTRFSDFFTMSECRDLLFHVQEARMTIPRIKAFIDEHKLTFLGFEFEIPVLQQYRNHFAASGWSMTDLTRWHEFETRYPDTFSGMYQFWIQKP